MDYNKEHIKQYTAADIKRYLKGQLSGAEMNAIEKAALDDPFLADAIEGMEYAMEKHGEDEITEGVADLERQVQARTTANKKTGTVISFRWLQITAAAVVLVVAGFGVFYFMGANKQRELATMKTVKVTDSVIPPKKVPDAFADVSSEKALSSVADSSAVFKSSSFSERKAAEKFEEDLVSTYKGNKEQPPAFLSPSAPVQNKPVDTLRFGNQVNNLDPAANKGYYAKLKEGEQAKRDSTERRNMANIPTEVVKTKDELRIRNQAAKKDNEGILNNYDKSLDTKLQGKISGIVTDNNYNPQANALLRINNSNGTYNTDNRGNFNIPAGDSAVNVSVTVIGYGTQNFSLSNNTFDNQLRLQPANSFSDNRGLATRQVSADSVADDKISVSKLSKQYRPTYPKVVIQDAEPVNGWLSFEQYLEKNKRVTSNFTTIPAEVIVSFQVNKKGELSAFKIDQPLSKEYNDEAIRLVKEGPAWKLLRGRKTRVTIIVRF